MNLLELIYYPFVPKNIRAVCKLITTSEWVFRKDEYSYFGKLTRSGTIYKDSYTDTKQYEDTKNTCIGYDSDKSFKIKFADGALITPKQIVCDHKKLLFLHPSAYLLYCVIHRTVRKSLKKIIIIL